MSIYVDLTEFLRDPHRSGIQRVCGELCRFWPAGKELIPVKLTQSQRLVALPPETLGVVRKYFEATDDGVTYQERHLRHLNSVAESSEVTITPGGEHKILVPEVFFQSERIRYFRGLSPEQLSNCGFILHDLLPFTHPEFFPPDAPQEILNGYARLMRTAPKVAFNSQSTRDAYYRRLLRVATVQGQVLRLGSDGLGLRPVSPPDLAELPPKFSVIGTIEPRKNHSLIIEAFEPLLRQIPELRLVFLGKMGWVDSAFAEKVQGMANRGYPGFEFHVSPTDECIRRQVQESRATIFVSAAEGFGLPPVESLWLGVPVIASPGVPSLEDCGDRGVCLVDPRDVHAFRKAVVAFLDPSYQRKKAEEALALCLPTWSSFAAETAAWIDAL